MLLLSMWVLVCQASFDVLFCAGADSADWSCSLLSLFSDLVALTAITVVVFFTIDRFIRFRNAPVLLLACSLLKVSSMNYALRLTTIRLLDSSSN